MAYIYLLVAILSEVAATTALKRADGFTHPLPSAIVVLGYGTAFYCLSLVLRSLPVSITYAIWSGLGIVLVTLAGAVFYRQMPDLAAWIGMGLILAGVLVIHLFSRSAVLS
ncbi:multidrug transporter [Acidihalobacter aeolianus]|uniref:Multidrug transporter n=1 Tax=Acidihalobacter aeolianus TaxID=2792603 RepID=A0A1D8K4S9_9GAMM|nr:multidrug efflux SMR transporter [Acidihalobacter aeolianus]AOV15956.1 multidrug transporter [Acidihalobacter aeolianus]